MRELLISPEKGSADRPAGDGDAALPQADAPEDDTAVVEASWLYTMAAMPENASLRQPPHRFRKQQFGRHQQYKNNAAERQPDKRGIFIGFR